MNVDQLVTTTGLMGLLRIIVELFSILAAWIVIQDVRFDVFLRQPRGVKARILQVMIAVIIGHLFANFLFSYWQWSSALKFLVE
ncbi:DUF1146 family protein [Paenibacillus sp. GCM10027626]|uniref:DUF1146 family protein n=1 Tax=Paenibacillus sp. GCM10027626 TaxID=3273411 RepID=UPI003634C430